ncbi:MAG TPA: BamA/TamA family outer membrane protein [Polyangia bacterium]|nr:BamA/TamA family outer membrane protein [Polyangia bacterium]
MAALALLMMVALAGAAAAPAGAESSGSQPQPSHREFNVIPVAGGDSDFGIGAGAVADWARLSPQSPPFVWRLETGGFISFKLRDGHSVVIPYLDYYLLYSRPGLGPGGRLRLDLRAAFTKETTLPFFGIGNATPEPPPGTALADTEFGRVRPTVGGNARITVAQHWFVQGGLQYTHNWMTVRPTSLLAQMQASGPPATRALLGNVAESHGVALLAGSVQYDSRDNEIVTRRGMFHALQLRVSPAVKDWLPYSYQQVTATARFFFTPWTRWLTISWRVVGDALLGSPPFYELGRFDENPALGGARGVRGVPALRYYGKVKLLENFELRSEIWSFSLWRKPMVLGVGAFADSGRLCAELGRRHPELDGTGWGLKYGLGGGLRLQQGETFVVRFDVAWSPDAHPVGAYFTAGEIF